MSVACPCALPNVSSAEKHIATLVASFPSLPLTPALSAAQLKFATSALTAGDMSVWMGPGRKLLEYSWTVPIFGVRLHGALWELHWGGWKMIALPGVLKSTPVILEKGPRLGAGFLAALCTSGKLGEVDLVWKKTVDRWLHDKLQNWERTEESVSFRNIMAQGDTDGTCRSRSCTISSP